MTLALASVPCRAQEAPEASPVVKSLSTVTAEQYQTITIKGTGFGTMAPYTGDSYYISFFDLRTSPPVGRPIHRIQRHHHSHCEFMDQHEDRSGRFFRGMEPSRL